MAGGDHALDRDRSFGDEQVVAFDLPADDGVLELAVVGETGIVRILDSLGHSTSFVAALTIERIRANIERVFWQGSLFGVCDPHFDTSFADVRRDDLDETSWVDHAPRWIRGSDNLLDELVGILPLRQRTGVHMYDRVVDEPRLTAWWQEQHGREPLSMLREMRLVLAEHYGEPFDSIGFNLYRDGHDSVAWHSDRHAKRMTNPIVAIVSLGAPRPFRMRPKQGGRSRVWDLGDGDLFVMGGASQHDWQHTVPKVRATTGPRMSISFRSW
jgi:alkylated DNA repair dioxygenase AlkB